MTERLRRLVAAVLEGPSARAVIGPAGSGLTQLLDAVAAEWPDGAPVGDVRCQARVTVAPNGVPERVEGLASSRVEGRLVAPMVAIDEGSYIRGSVDPKNSSPSRWS